MARRARRAALADLRRHELSVSCRSVGNHRQSQTRHDVLDPLKAWMDEPHKGNGNILFPTFRGGRLSADAVQYLLAKHVAKAAEQCPSLRAKRLSPHVLRPSAAMELLDAGVDSTVISLWLGHESTNSTQPYLDAHLAIKEAALAKTTPYGDQTHRRFKADDKLLSFLDKL
ncbi:tyrosine-type recombinase/integrase [Rhizobium ruizarguesonis]|uniref:tyrosine-type recombinase/integrase n=1 Tax=Rhizobium ruizarguesonis TaxID=2081791 RepID=UPI00296229F6|nr:tyrosine-type recombinase/integrase [Rhizobium ruizarguesonis]